MASLEGFLNVAIPVGVFFFLAAAIYGKTASSVKAFIAWIIDMFGWASDKVGSGGQNVQQEIIYR